MRKPSTSTSAFERAAERKETERYLLRLYVAGSTPGSTRAVEVLKAICEEYLGGRYDLEVIDVYQQPDRARDEQIFAVPTLVKYLPPPLRTVLGDLSDTKKVLRGLDLKPKSDEKKRTSKKL